MRYAWLLLAACSLAPAFGAEPQRVYLVVERHQGSSWRVVNAATVFGQGDSLRFRMTANFPGYLYVMNHGSSGSYDLLFPRTETGMQNRIEASKEYVVPATAQGSFKITGPPGHDIIYWVISPTDLAGQPQAYQPLPPPPAKPDLPATFRPRCDDSIFKARGDCIDTSAGVKPLSSGEKVPDNLTGVAKPTPRELIFIQQQGGVMLSSPTPLPGPLVYELRLAHR